MQLGCQVLSLQQDWFQHNQTPGSLRRIKAEPLLCGPAETWQGSQPSYHKLRSQACLEAALSARRSKVVLLLLQSCGGHGARCGVWLAAGRAQGIGGGGRGQRKETSSTCRMEVLGRGLVLCDIWGVGAPARALRCQNARPTCALLLCPPVSRPEPEQAETPQERDSEEGKWRCALAASAWPPSALAEGPGALTLSLSCALASGRTNPSAPSPRCSS